MRAGAFRPYGGLIVGVVTAVSGCAGTTTRSTELPAYYQPIQAGRGPRYRLPALSSTVARRGPVAGLRCTNTRGRHYGVHLELFAERRVLPIPAGIGVAPPLRKRGVYVRSGACSYPIASFEPTGVFVVAAGHAVPTLGQLFALWGQPLSATSLARFRGHVTAYLGGDRWPGRPGAIPLRRHAVIAVEVSGKVLPHPTYVFPPGL